MQGTDAEITGLLLAGPGLFVLGSFFVMLPFVAVRVFGLVLIAFTALSGNLAAPGFDWNLYLAFGLLTVLALAAGAWLGYRLTEGRIQDLIREHDREHDAQVEHQRKQLLVPYAKDGSWFHPGLAYADGRFRIGQRETERAVINYQHALHLLREMPVAAWRRPSPRSGIYNTVTAIHWAPPPRGASQRKPDRTPARAA